MLLYAAACWIVTASFVHWYEEPTLSRRFGAEYEGYRRAVPAWWPRLHPLSPEGLAGQGDVMSETATRHAVGRTGQVQRRDTWRMKNYMMIKQRVADFAQFQAAFDELLPRRQEFGLIDIGTFREASEPDTIVVLLEVTDVARAKEYWHSQVLEAGRRKAGIVGPLQAGTDQVWLTNGPVIQ